MSIHYIESTFENIVITNITSSTNIPLIELTKSTTTMDNVTFDNITFK